MWASTGEILDLFDRLELAGSEQLEEQVDVAMALIREKREGGRKKRRGSAMGNGLLLHVGACGSNPDQEIRALALSYLPPTPPLQP